MLDISADTCPFYDFPPFLFLKPTTLSPVPWSKDALTPLGQKPSKSVRLTQFASTRRVQFSRNSLGQRRILCPPCTVRCRLAPIDRRLVLHPYWQGS